MHILFLKCNTLLINGGTMKRFIKKFSSSQIIILGFIGVIMFGCILLMLPISTVSGKGASFIDSLFTSTSAVCVTGLVLKDTATYWSSFGQFVILLLIQIGGMGIITIAIAVSIVSGKHIGLKQRSTMQDSISAPKVGGIVRLVGFILKMTFLIEILGSLIMSPIFIKEFGILKGIWYSLFHSISAFCNAGFDLMGVKSQFSSLSYFKDNIIINVVIMSLIIIGGIGFMTWDDIRTNKFHFKKYKMQSKVILITTLILIVLPSLYYFFFEFNNLPFNTRLLGSIFQTITPRTAGFNTIDLNTMSETGTAIMIILMLIGGSSGSCAGGMKTTTVAVIFSTVLSVFKKEEYTHFFGFRVDNEVVRNALAIFALYIILFTSAGLIISKIENISFINTLFETASAIGTVGLTKGITCELHTISKLILIFLMYVGRVGGLTLVFATISHKSEKVARLPLEKITVG